MDAKYQYDVAFSFLSQDEGLAQQLADALGGRFSAFHYADRQEDIAGTDGEQTFNRIFGSEARLVVVLYRAGWGQKGMTLVESTAIRNRAYAEGYDFTCWISLDDVALPPWVPKTRIWLSMQRFGIPGAMGVIEARLADVGAEPTPDSAVDQAARLQREHERETARQALLSSMSGVQAAKVEVSALRTGLREIVQAMEISAPAITAYYRQSQDGQFTVGANLAWATVRWAPQYSNSLTHATLFVNVYCSTPSLSASGDDEPQHLLKREYKFDVQPDGSFGWRPRDEPARIESSKSLADSLVKLLLEKSPGSGE